MSSASYGDTTIKQIGAGIATWLIIQLLGSVWWASSVTTRVDQIEVNMIRGTEISERLACVETQLKNLNSVIGSLSDELRDLRRTK